MTTLKVRDLLNFINEMVKEYPSTLDNEVCLRVQDDDAITMVGGLFSFSFDKGCTDTLALMLDAHTDAESEETDE